MKHIKKTLVTGSAIALLAAAFAPVAFAEDVVIVDNGAFSQNGVEIDSTHTTVVSQSSSTNVTNNITNVANTGGNSSSFNTGGPSSITTGAATATTSVAVTGGSNAAVLGPDCGCINGTGLITLMGNGAFSVNGVSITRTSSRVVGQSAVLNVTNTIRNRARTGKNSSAFNTSGGGTISTGPAASTTTVTVTGGSNTSL